MGEGMSARALNAKHFFEFLETFQPGAQAHLRAMLPDTVIQEVLGATRISWNDVETIDGPYVTAIVRWLGEDRALNAWRTYTHKHFIYNSAIRALAEEGARLFGLSVGSLVRGIPFAFRQGFRGCGEVKAEVGEDDARVEMTLVQAFARYEAYAVLFHGLFLGVFDIVRAKPQLDYRVDIPAGHIVATFRW